MKIESVAPQAQPQSQNNAAQSARERAISQLLGAAPDVNQNAVAPEESAAVKDTSTPAEPTKSSEDNGQTNNTEESSTKATKDEAPISSQFAQLAKKEKAIRAQAAELKRQRDAFKAEQDALKAQTPQTPTFDQSKYIDKEELKNNTWERLQELGITYDQLTQQALNSSSPLDAELKKLRAQVAEELKGVREEQEKARKAAEDQQTAAYKQAVDQIKADTRRLVDSDPAFEMIKATDSVDDVAELIEETFRKDKRLMTVEEAAKEVEDFLTEEASRLARLGKIQKLLKPEAPAAATAPKTPVQPQKSQTLTNSLSSQNRMTARERAIAAFQSAMKK